MQENVFQTVRRMIRQSGATGMLVAVNVAVALVFGLIGAVEYLYKQPELTDSIKIWFAAPGNPADLIYKPWSIITQLFTHGDVMHLLLNMMVLFFTGMMFRQYFGEKRLITTYFLGGIAAYLTHVSAYFIFPVFSEHAPPGILGASGAVMAIFMAVAFHRPGQRVYLFGLLPVPIIALALLYIFVDLRGVTESDNVAHFAHLGGALFGALSIINIGSPKNFMNRIERFFSRFKFRMPSFKRKPKMKVYRNEARDMTDEEYNKNRKAHQERVDAILDKISKKGYDGLTKEEKEILFNESNRK